MAVSAFSEKQFDNDDCRIRDHSGGAAWLARAWLMNNLGITKAMAKIAMQEGIRYASNPHGGLIVSAGQIGLCELGDVFWESSSIYGMHIFSPHYSKQGQNQRLLFLAMVYTLGNDQ